MKLLSIINIIFFLAMILVDFLNSDLDLYIKLRSLSIMTFSITISIMADGPYAECHLCQVSLMLSVANRAFYTDCLYA